MRITYFCHKSGNERGIKSNPFLLYDLWMQYWCLSVYEIGAPLWTA